MVEIKTAYSELKKKYKDLPSFEDLDNEFEISGVEDNFILRGIRRKCVEKVEFFAKIVEDLLQPDANLTNMYECRDFGDGEKENIYNLFKRLMFFSRSAAEVALKSDDKEDARFLSVFFNSWMDLKPDLMVIVSKITDSWERDTEFKEDLEYFG